MYVYVHVAKYILKKLVHVKISHTDADRQELGLTVNCLDRRRKNIKAAGDPYGVHTGIDGGP